MGFMNYVSPRMRREAKSQVNTIQNLFNDTYTALLNARRLEAINISIQAQQYQQQLASAQQEVAARDAQIAILQAQLLFQSQKA